MGTEEIVMPKLLPFSRQRGLSDSQKWIRAFTRQMMHQYEKNQRVVPPEDGVEHVVFLSDRYVDMALVITLDQRQGSTEFNVINRFAEVGQALASIKNKETPQMSRERKYKFKMTRFS